MNSDLYIELMKKVLTDLHRIDLVEFAPERYSQTLKSKLLKALDQFLNKRGFFICRKVKSDYSARVEGLDWPLNADTMIGIKRLNNIQFCIEEILKNNIEGDFIETGVWRGGATIFMNAVLKANGVNTRQVWVADSFEGLPRPNEDKYTYDKNDRHYLVDTLAVSLDTVKNNFRKYDLLTDNVNFLKGWFKDTLTSVPIKKLSLLRLDGDMYESTMDSLTNLYPKLSPGGFIIIDDWGAVNGCKQAVLDYRKKNNITEEIIEIDKLSVFWKRLN